MTVSRARAAVWSAAVAIAVAAVVAGLVWTNTRNDDGPLVAGPIPTPTTTVNPSKAPALPFRGAYFGARVQPARLTQRDSIAAVRALQRQIGRRLDIVHTYLRWQAPFPNPSSLAYLRQGSMLLLSWAGADTKAIASGAYDDWIRQRARAIKATHKRIFLEWRWEMNRPGLAAEVHSPADYIAAWDHIRAIFDRVHVDNVTWVWCPASKGFGPNLRGYRSGAAFYPGNREVDWICVDVYPPFRGYYSFADLVRPFLAWAAHIRKPIMIGEFGVPVRYGTQRRAQWLREAAQTVREDPQIKALVYFDGNELHGYAEHAYAVQPGSAEMQAFRSIAVSQYFNPLNRPVSGG